MVINIAGVLIGLIILIAGVYYVIKEGKDPDSKKIYSVTSVIGIVITIVFVLRLLLS